MTSTATTWSWTSSTAPPGCPGGWRTCGRRWATPGCAPVPGPGSTARTCPRSPAGPGRTDMRVLVVNAGSSSLKVDLVDDGVAVESFGGLPGVPPRVDAVGHRIVHGGPDLSEPVVIDAGIEQQLRALV